LHYERILTKIKVVCGLKVHIYVRQELTWTNQDSLLSVWVRLYVTKMSINTVHKDATAFRYAGCALIKKRPYRYISFSPIRSQTQALWRNSL
jgi:hypothetical protein